MAKTILATKSDQFQKKVKLAPRRPGIYMYKNSESKVLYVGKAKILRNRVNSYFNNFAKIEPRIQGMIEQARDIEMIEVDTEFDALILETNLIKKYRPKYNVLMKDDKNYSYVRFEKMRRSTMPNPTKNSVYQDFPRITVVREKKNDGAEYFGPYPDARPIKRVLKRIRKVFPYRTSNHTIVQLNDNPLEVKTTATRPCFYYHIGLCNGACAGLESKQEYNKRFNNIKTFFKGEKKSIINEIEREMKELSHNQQYEEAAKLRDKIRDIEYITEYISIDNEVDDIIIQQEKTKHKEAAVEQLIEKLKFPSSKLFNHSNFRIECYDISNIQGSNSTGSMVVQIDGEAQPSLYRRFKIKTLDTPNDFAMMQEVLGRRFNQLLMSKRDSLKEKKNINRSLIRRMKQWKPDESFSQRPDLIIIDGGKGQLTSAYEVLKLFELENEIAIVGLAKREEELFKMREQFKHERISDTENRFERVLLPRRSESLYLVQRIRDEAHRFAKNYHIKLRNKKLIDTVENK